ncbi:MAG: hypothetical protein V9E81_06075 [Marmoricola sp.]
MSYPTWSAPPSRSARRTVDRHPAHTLSQVVVPSTKGRWLVLTDAGQVIRALLVAFATTWVRAERRRNAAAHELEAGNRIRTALLAAFARSRLAPGPGGEL